MQYIDLPHTDLHASKVVLGLVQIADLDAGDIRALYSAAREAGITMFDNATVYGGWHGCETKWGEAISLSSSERDEVILQTKVGIGLGSGFYDFSYDHIVSAVHESLAAMRTDYLDSLLLHRPDTLVEPEEVARAFDDLHRAGKVHHFGVSNHTPGQIEVLQTSVTRPLAINQMQFSITHANLVAQGLSVNMGGLEQSVSRDNDALSYARVHGQTLQAWSPFRAGWGDGTFLGDREHYGELNDVLTELAAAHGVTATGIVVAWHSRHPARMQTVIGTSKPGRITEAAAGADVELTREEWYRIFTAAGNTLP